MDSFTPEKCAQLARKFADPNLDKTRKMAALIALASYEITRTLRQLPAGDSPAREPLTQALNEPTGRGLFSYILFMCSTVDGKRFVPMDGGYVEEEVAAVLDAYKGDDRKDRLVQNGYLQSKNQLLKPDFTGVLTQACEADGEAIRTELSVLGRAAAQFLDSIGVDRARIRREHNKTWHEATKRLFDIKLQS